MIKVVAHPGCPPDRAIVFGAPARIKKVTLGPSAIENVDGSDVVTIPVTWDVEFDPIYTAVIKL